MRPPISTADLLRAFAGVDPQTDDEKGAIAAMLGFNWQAPSGEEEDAQTVTPEVPTVAPRGHRVRRKEAPPDPPPRDDTQPQAGGNIRISPPRPVARPHLEWLSAGPALPAGTLGRAHKPAPLFRSNWTRAILSATLSARRPIGPPDLERAVEMIARGQALRQLPRQPILTLARGVQALIDVGDAMQPFAEDRAVLRRDLQRIVGGDSLDIVECAGSPREVRRDADAFEWQEYGPRFAPQLDACVLIVSDFGISSASGLARRASPYTWAMLARRLKRAGHRVVGFVPYPTARWPAVLARAVDLVTWDRATSVGRISLSRARRGRA
jgi:hypothetical protein